jgi:glycosyltransferase involved in cell wall biosynthesis
MTEDPKIPVSVLITTKDEEQNILRCFEPLKNFAEIIVIDSNSIDKTCAIAKSTGAKIITYAWNGVYPKKRQWCLDNLQLLHDWVFFVDADEIVTSALISEMYEIFSKNIPQTAGFFIRGQYLWNGKTLNYGLQNNKLALFNRHKIAFPVVNDLDIPGMGEIEGHYQPILKPEFKHEKLGQLKSPLLHHAYEDQTAWESRHQRYAAWEAGMNAKNAWPADPIPWRNFAKKTLRKSKFRPEITFLYSYIVKRGFLDGKSGLAFALSRRKYARMIENLTQPKKR